MSAQAQARSHAHGSRANEPEPLHRLVARFDGSVFDARRRVTRVRLVLDEQSWDAVIEDDRARIEASRGRADAIISADERTWRELAEDTRTSMAAYRSGRLLVRRNMHLGVGFIAATSGDRRRGRLRFRTLHTRAGRISVLEAGSGPAILCLHGLGASKSSFLPTVGALSSGFRVIAVDQLGFGDSDKPIGAAYDAGFLAAGALALLDELGLERAHLVGNSLGGRVALELALLEPERVARLGLLAPSLAWLRARPWLPLLRLARPELGLVQIAPRRVVEAILHRLLPGAREGWAAAGVDEFLRAYLTPAGRAAFYAAARHIFLEAPHGEQGFWTRLAALSPDALFVWGRHDPLVPLAFRRHVAAALPRAQHVVLECGHVPQIELPRQTHAALARFFKG